MGGRHQTARWGGALSDWLPQGLLWGLGWMGRGGLGAKAWGKDRAATGRQFGAARVFPLLRPVWRTTAWSARQTWLGLESRPQGRSRGQARGIEMTELDRAHAAMQAGGDAEALRFYQILADATLYLLLDHEAEGERINPRVFDLEDGPVLLAYDTEERLAALGQGPQPDAALPYAALPGRIIAQHLAGQGVALGLNFGSGAPSEVMLPPEAMGWLAEMLETAPESVEALPEAFFSPQGLPDALTDALTFTLSGAAGLAQAALLVAVRYAGGRRGHILAVIGAPPTAQEALARALAEALAFSGIEAGELDVTFLAGDDAAVAGMARVAQIFEVPDQVVTPVVERAAPGSDPARPPLLR